VAVLDRSECARDRGRNPPPVVKVAQQPEGRLGSNGIRQERLARERCQDVGVWVIIGGMTGRDHRAPGMIGLDVAHDVM
jgi:hypothetical protein